MAAEDLLAISDNGRRSLANMIEVMIRDYCERNGLVIADNGAAIG
jgi:hypothetical protein